MTNIQTLVTENLDVWTSAIQTKSGVGRGNGKKLNLYGIKKLRGLILELAVRGKLVPQDKNDEPASVLLKKITAEKERLIKEKKIKKPKKLPEIGEGEKLFELPQGWAWCQLWDIAEISMGQSPNGNSYNALGNGVPLVNGPVEFGGIEPFAKTNAIKFTTAPTKMCKKGDLLLCVRGSTTGRTNIAGFDSCIGRGVAALTSYIYKYFFNYFILCKRQNLYESGTGSTFPNISYDKIAGFNISLPPIKEQHRIAAKVDELMALCDQLEQQTKDSITAHKTLVENLLATITNSRNAKDLTQNWNRISDHFDTLFTTEESIDQLKQTILQLAVMGKLVPQDQNDEPATVLLEKIAIKKARLIKEKKIKKQKELPPIGDGEKPFELPQGWEWVRLNAITSKITDGDHKTPPRIPKGYRLLSAKNVRDGFIDYDHCDFIAEKDYLKSRMRCLPEIGNLLIVSVGGTIGRSSLVVKDSKFALVRSVALIKPMIFRSNYLKLAMDSELLQKMIHNKKRGGAQPCLYLSEISLFLFPLPPLSEQHRIVAKVEELMILCNKLKLNFSDSQTTQLNLTNAIIEKAVS